MPSSPKPNLILYLPCLSWFVFNLMMPCLAAFQFLSDTILPGQQLRDWDVMTSANGLFKLRFFSPGSSKFRYLGILLQPDFANSEEEAVWVGNRNQPIDNPSGILVINGSTGMLNIQHDWGIINLPTNLVTGYRNISTSATLQDDGNLVLRQICPNGSISKVILWQSFDYPTDTLLPGMKLGINLKTGHEWFLTSWASDDMPHSGSFTLGMDRNNTNQLFIWWHRKLFWTGGPWQDDPLFKIGINGEFVFTYISNVNDKYLTYDLQKGSELDLIRLGKDGSVLLRYKAPLFSCYFGIYIPQDDGCVNYSFPTCKNGDDFVTVYKSDLQNVIRERLSRNLISLSDCEAKCRKNCSCLGYTLLDANRICVFWITIEDFELTRPNFPANLIYIRSGLLIRQQRKQGRWWRWWELLLIAFGGILLLLTGIFYITRKYWKTGTTTPAIKHIIGGKWLNEENVNIHQFSFETIEIATNNFSEENKLGEGGFGSVYMGKLLDEQEIAIKRLSKGSSQGPMEFKNETQLIVKLQHNNLVRLLGCCIHREEMMLVYEYMPNKSLDFIIFDPKKGELLRWRNRMNIIEGIAQGLLYLHKHSRLKVIHRDLKASNILLDKNMTPKISDFGMARIFGMQNVEDKTKRIVGTRGYMPPEYVIKGVVSTKTDVFSFGVLVLEIVSGKKNYRSYHSERPLNLVGMAWELWMEQRAIDLVDKTIDVSNHLNEVKRCINVGLLCVQDRAADRLSMTDVILMLKNDSLQLPQPKQPAFYIGTGIAKLRHIDDSNTKKNCMH